MSKLKSLCFMCLCISNASATYSWEVLGGWGSSGNDGMTADETATKTILGVSQAVEYYRFGSTDVGKDVIYGTVTDTTAGTSADFVFSLNTYSNFGRTNSSMTAANEGTSALYNTDNLGATAGDRNDNSFASYTNTGQLDLFTSFVRNPADSDHTDGSFSLNDPTREANANIIFDLQLYDLGTYAYDIATGEGTPGASNTTAFFSFGSPVDDNQIGALFRGEEYTATWVGGNGAVYDPDNQITEIGGPDYNGTLGFHASPTISDVLTSNYALFTDESTSYTLQRQDRVTQEGRTGIRSGITLGTSTITLPGGGDISENGQVPEPSSSLLLAVSMAGMLVRRKR